MDIHLSLHGKPESRVVNVFFLPESVKNCCSSRAAWIRIVKKKKSKQYVQTHTFTLTEPVTFVLPKTQSNYLFSFSAVYPIYKNSLETCSKTEVIAGTFPHKASELLI